MKPILFNTEMVRAILEGQKTQTRRIITQHRYDTTYWPPKDSTYKGMSLNMATFERVWYDLGVVKKQEMYCFIRPYSIGDIIYIRETWAKDSYRYLYRADYADDEHFYQDGKEIQMKWHPSIHMPKEAARIFLRVTDVRVERLKDISYEDCISEGIYDTYKTLSEEYHEMLAKVAYRKQFGKLWDSTINREVLFRCGWEANPWVWVISFERISREEAKK